jgi:hypothetical protein
LKTVGLQGPVSSNLTASAVGTMSAAGQELPLKYDRYSA